MVATSKEPAASVLNKSDDQNPRIGWVEKHAELIAKLEAEYQPSKEAKSKPTVTRYYEFNVAGINLLIPNHISSEIFEDRIIYSIPLAPSWILGACSVRGDIVPIIDLPRILNQKNSHTDSSKYNTLILGNGEDSIGLLLKKLPTPIQFDKKERITNYLKLPDLLQPYITVAYKRKRKTWIVIDYSSFFAALTN